LLSFFIIINSKAMKKIIEWTGGDAFTGINLAAYRSPKTGMAIVWTDEFGLPNSTGPILSEKKTLITDETPRGKEFLMYVEDHPVKTKLGWIQIRDLTAEEQAEASKVSNKVAIMARYYTMGEQELRETLMLARLDSSGTLADMQARVQIIADNSSTGIQTLERGLREGDREYIITVIKSLEKGLITRANNRYYLGDEKGEIIGFAEDQVIMYLKEHEKEYAFLLRSLEGVQGDGEKRPPFDKNARPAKPAPKIPMS
jgi:hypothetical protein